MVAERGSGIFGRARRTRRDGGSPGRSPVRLLRKAALRDPLLVAAFDGWNDAGEAASGAVAELARQWRAQPFAEVDPEEFVDFTETRPEVVSTPDGGRRIGWPVTSLSIATAPGLGRDVVLLRGPEPQLRWPTYCDTVVGLARGIGIGEVVLLGAYLSEVTHHRAVPLSGTATAAARLDALGIEPSQYEGPTGIVGVLGEVFAAAGVPVTSVWASVPCYSLPVSPKASLALLRVTGLLLGGGVDDGELADLAEEYERRMDELVADDDGVAAYVARLEEMEGSGDDLSGEGLAEEIERFLRRRP